MVQAVILAGGLGTRISEESHLKPKPMIEIGGKPILWHIMKIYAYHGITDFIICCGYKGYVIKEFFANYFLHTSDITFDLSENQMEIHKRNSDNWKVTLVDTGENTMTGGRVKRIASYINGTFCLTYGDGVSNIDISALLKFHESRNAEVTITAVQPTGRFGIMKLKGDLVSSFQEKPKGDDHWVNGGFMVCQPSIFNRLQNDETILEHDPLSGLANDGQLSVYKHKGFWYAMDTLRDRNYLEQLWSKNEAPWRIWY
jgi:glucose-1-phosphate cytidylyltransferase